MQGFPARILETRKTVPGMRVLDKWAVLIGGGSNHRIGLFDMVMIKNNHIAAAGGVQAAIRCCQVRRPFSWQSRCLPELRICLRGCLFLGCTDGVHLCWSVLDVPPPSCLGRISAPCWNLPPGHKLESGAPGSRLMSALVSRPYKTRAGIRSTS